MLFKNHGTVIHHNEIYVFNCINVIIGAFVVDMVINIVVGKCLVLIVSIVGIVVIIVVIAIVVIVSIIVVIALFSSISFGWSAFLSMVLD